MRNVLDYGAKGDGVTLDTAAIQSALDAGGVVYFPAGEYRTGTIYLKSHGGLYLDHGATIKGSHDRADYNADDFCPQNEVFDDEFVTGAHLIVAVGQTDISLGGYGTIDGEGRHWMNENNTYNERGDYTPNAERPAQMVYLCECRGVKISDLNLVNGPYWHLFLHACEDVSVRGITIRGDRQRWTNDGIDVDCCKGVRISDCLIDVGDDALTIRAHKKTVNRTASENVTVTNCVLRAHNDYGVRIGVGAGEIRDCALSNLEIEAPNWGGLGIMSVWSKESKYATTIENILISNVSVRAKRPIEFFVAPEPLALPNPCRINNIRLTGVMLYPVERSKICGMDEKNRINNVIFEGVTVRCDDLEVPTEEIFVINHANAVELNGVRLIGREGKFATVTENRKYIDE